MKAWNIKNIIDVFKCDQMKVEQFLLFYLTTEMADAL